MICRKRIEKLLRGGEFFVMVLLILSDSPVTGTALRTLFKLPTTVGMLGVGFIK